MKKLMLLLSVLLMAGYMFVTRSNTMPSLHPVSSKPSKSMSGFYEQEDPDGRIASEQIQLQLRFLDDTHVDMLQDYKKIGDNPVTYTIQGNELTITHACGVWNMEIQ